LARLSARANSPATGSHTSAARESGVGDETIFDGVTEVNETEVNESAGPASAYHRVIMPGEDELARVHRELIRGLLEEGVQNGRF